MTTIRTTDGSGSSMVHLCTWESNDDGKAAQSCHLYTQKKEMGKTEQWKRRKKKKRGWVASRRRRGTVGFQEKERGRARVAMQGSSGRRASSGTSGR